MVSKKHSLNDLEAIGLSDDEAVLANKYLRTHSVSSAIQDAAGLYELYVLGYSFQEINQQYPKYQLGQIIMTAALGGWYTKKEQLRASVKDRVQAQVSKAVIEQVEFLTSLFTVATVDNVKEMKDYVSDPANNKRPRMAINSLKEYKEAVEMLAKVLQSVGGSTETPTSKKSKKIEVREESTEIIDLKALAGMTDE